MATYAFFVACMFGRQHVKTEDNEELRGHRYDYYVPIFTILQLMFYMGLLKVAEQLINPFGDDDEDFELNWIIDRHMKVSYLGVDTLNGAPPPLVKDTYYNELDVKIPYTEASRTYKKKTYRGSVAYMQVPMEQQSMVLPELLEESEDDGENLSESMGPRRGSVYTLFHGKSTSRASPSGSFGNLDTASLDSEWKGSLLNLNHERKNSTGTLGRSQESAINVDLSKTENDEIVLQEVVVEPKTSKGKHPTAVSRSDSLQIPGMTLTPPHQEKSSSLLCVRKDVSPKIAPKFPREKLKSMFKKRQLTKSALTIPFMKLKGVTFSKDTKDEENSSEDDETSLVTVLPDDELEVDITLSNPELTEIEKQMGVHPYQALQAVSPEDLTKGRTTLSVMSTAKKLGGSHNVLGPRDMEDILLPEVHKSVSLPNIQEASLSIAQIALIPTLGKVTIHRKSKTRKAKKKKRKSPPPTQRSSDTLSEKESEDVIDDDARRNTLPQILVTRSGHITSEHLDLATSSGLSSTSDHSTDSYQVPPAVPKRGSVPRATPVRPPPKDPSGPCTKEVPRATGVIVQPSTASQKTKTSQVPAPKTHSTQAPKQTQQTKTFSGPLRTHSLPAGQKPKIRIRTASPVKPKIPEQPLPEKPRRTQQTAMTVKMPSVSSSSPPLGASGPTSPVRVIPSSRTASSFPKMTSKPPPVPRQQQQHRVQLAEGTAVIYDTAQQRVSVPAGSGPSTQGETTSSGRSRAPDRTDQSFRSIDHSPSGSRVTRKDSASQK